MSLVFCYVHLLLTLKNNSNILSISEEGSAMKKLLCLIVLITICIASGCLDDCTPVTKTSFKVIVASQNEYSKIDLSPSSVDGTVGYSIQFVAKAYDNNGYAPNAKIDWVISRGNGIISSNGVFTPTSTGTVVVSAKAGNTVSNALVTVKSKPRQSRYYYSYYDDDRNHNDYYYNNYYSGTTYDDLCSREHNHGTSC